ncbi:MAG: hypothetical protein HYR71_12660 [Chloroflexi bacterium]|nr:hypothetical protein [Chloroflexota bacterium]
MLVLSAIACPCHLPISLPLTLALLAGTPAAVWITQNVGWVYGGMTILFVVSLAFGLRWMGQANAAREVCEQRPAHSIKMPSIQTAPKE